LQVEVGLLVRAFEGRLVSSLAAALQVEQVWQAEQVSQVEQVSLAVRVLRAGQVERAERVLQVAL
jgi:hypothetical protein